MSGPGLSGYRPTGVQAVPSVHDVDEHAAMINRPPPPPKFDRPAKRRIAADWLERFPGYVPI